MLVSARRFSELGASSSASIEELEVVDHRTRPLRAVAVESEASSPEGAGSAEENHDDPED